MISTTTFNDPNWTLSPAYSSPPPTKNLKLPFDHENAVAKLENQSSTDEDIAALFIVAFEREQQEDLNQAIQSVRQRGSFVLSEKVKTLLHDTQIELIEHPRGTVTMSLLLHTTPDPRRSRRLEQTLTNTLPMVVCNIIKSYEEQQFQFNATNKAGLKRALEMSDLSLKEKIIRQAGQLGEERFLNKLFREIRRENERISPYGLNLAGINLSRLELNGEYAIDFSFTNLAGADLQDSNLESACLRGADLEKANLRGTNLKDVNLRRACLYKSNFHEALNTEYADTFGASTPGRYVEDTMESLMDMSRIEALERSFDFLR